MPEEILFETERRESRESIAALLRDVAGKLESGDPVTMSAGEQSITLEVPDSPTFEVKVEREYDHGAESGELSIEFELEWPEDGASGDDSLSVE